MQLDFPTLKYLWWLYEISSRTTEGDKLGDHDRRDGHDQEKQRYCTKEPSISQEVTT